MNYFSFHIGDYAARTRYLSPMADLAFRRLMDLYYTLEGAIPAENVAAEIGLEEYAAEVDLVLRKFFVFCEGVWMNTRCDEEITKYREKAERNREVGKLGGRPRTQTEPTVNPDGFQKEPIGNPPKNQEPRTNNQVEKKPSASRARRCPEGFTPSGLNLASMRAECPDIDLERETAKFRDWEFKTARSDWPAAWRTWMRKAQEDHRTRRPRQPVSFKAQDEAAAAEKYRRWTGQSDPLDVIDMEQTHGPLIANG